MTYKEAIDYLINGISDEAMDIAVDCIEKRIPKKPRVEHRQYYCHECRTKLITYNWSGGIHYCYHCGQRIDWSDEE